MMLLLFTGGCAFSDILGDLVCDEVFGGSALFVASIFVPQPLQNFCPGLSFLPQFGQITFDSHSVFQILVLLILFLHHICYRILIHPVFLFCSWDIS